MDYLRKFVGSQPEGQAPTGAATVERLCDRVQSSTLLEDRRDAVRALKSLSKKFRLDVGTQSMDILIHVLQTDRNDGEILGYALETLCNVMSDEPSEEEEEIAKTADLPDDIGKQFTEMFVKTTENVGILLSLLEEYDFHVRWPTVKLITILLTNRCKDIQEIILTNPMGISKLMDLLSDSREIIRNDGLLLLIQLTRNNTNIQKIVAFESAFERLIDIVADEGNSEGGIVVEDCLLLLLNLLKSNLSNQTFFKEGSYIQRLPPYFELQPVEANPQGGWSAQKVTNIHLMLQLVRTLVSPNNPQQQTTSCQKVMNICGLLEKLSSILMASGVPADVLTETINTVSEVIRGNQGNQEYFASVLAPSNPPRPAIVVLLMSMVNERQPFVLRCAVLYCFQSFLYKNELGQSQIIQTLLPSTAEVNTVTAGQLLCGGLFSTDPRSTWFAAVAMLHSIVDNMTQKEQLLRVQLATSLGNPPVSLLQQCSNILAQGGKVQTRVGLLMLMCHWLEHCPIAVTHFLHSNVNVPFLISQVSASEVDEMEQVVQGMCAFLLGICVLYNEDEVDGSHKSDLRQVIERRIGLEQFTDKLSQVSKHEMYSKAAKKPQLNYVQPSDVIFDYAFTRLLKKLETEVLRAISPEQENEIDEKKVKASLDQHESIVAQYKELIREQDSQLNVLRGELSDLKSKSAETEKKLAEMTQQVQQLKDQNSLLKTQRGSPPGVQGEIGELGKLQQEMDTKKKEIEDKNSQIEQLKTSLTQSEAKTLNHEGPEGENEVLSAGDASVLQSTVSCLNTDLDQLRKKMEQKEEEVKLYRSKYDDTSKQVADLREQAVSGNSDDKANMALLAERNSMSEKIDELEDKLRQLMADNGKLKEQRESAESRLGKTTVERDSLDARVQELDQEKSELEADKMQSDMDADGQKKEQDDLLVLLADQDTKIKQFRKMLKDAGVKIEDDDEDDDDDDFELEDEDEDEKDD